MRDAVRDEIVGLHRFFEAWMAGTLEDTDAVFDRLASVVAPGFVLISPDARVTSRGDLLASLRTTHAVHRNADPPFRIWIEGYRFTSLPSGLGLALYEEWQEKGGEVRGRVSTALFETCEGTPHGVCWLRVHETWLPEA
ncbi:MAG: hypothetical protein ACYTG6_00670 [Planctomycetota bacterium]